MKQIIFMIYFRFTYGGAGPFGNIAFFLKSWNLDYGLRMN